MTVSVLTYNILADAYLRPEYYAEVPPAVLEPDRRRRALLEVLAGADADVLCLQEVEPEVFDHLAGRLEPLGYAGHYGQKGRGRPDGCATFVRVERFERHAATALHYVDGAGRGGDSGHLALMVTLETGDLALGVANT
ncbi:MAG: endonuclease/exonuclease/phosphatase family protein, partial [Myxococcota bacterium]|nr:endonuclease/exonuclease/phosphatase family protein [Myxococcota bacterium]